MWRQTRVAAEFCTEHLPLAEMSAADELLSSKGGHVLAAPGQSYAVYLKDVRNVTLDLTKAKGVFRVRWLDAKAGGPLQTGTVSEIRGGTPVSLGVPNEDAAGDWVCLVERAEP